MTAKQPKKKGLKKSRDVKLNKDDHIELQMIRKEDLTDSTTSRAGHKKVDILN